jgi:drug/metabolite transporter (DMT)-like permease
MAKGTMMIVAPIAATGAVIPVLVGISRGDNVTGVAVAGIILAVLGTALASWQPPSTDRAASGGLGIALALSAAAAIGAFLTLLNLASRDNPLGATEVMRLTSCVIAVAAFACVRMRDRRMRLRDGQHTGMGDTAPGRLATAGAPHAGSASPARDRLEQGEQVEQVDRLDRRDPREPSPPALGGSPAGLMASARKTVPVFSVLAAIGAADTIAEVCFARASADGPLSIVSALASLYPAVTVILAVAVLRERAHVVQVTGAVSAMAGALCLGMALG